MAKKGRQRDPYIGTEPDPGYFLREKVGKGRIGSVYRAVKSRPFRDELACKVIPEGRLKDGWQRELEKVVRLRGVPHVVEYHRHGTAMDNNNRPFVWVLWNYIDGINLRKYAEKRPWPLDLAFVENIVTTVLEVLHACDAVGIRHGDLHEGNILISKPDIRLPGNPRTIWISDFGYGGSHNQLEPKDDFRQFFSITSSLLRILKRSRLNPRDKILHQKLAEFLPKKILEVDHTQGLYVGSPESLLQDFSSLSVEAESESAAGAIEQGIKGPGDYLFAEALGYRVEEWKDLFVPEFLAAQDLLNRNITVLTGARGCGKTMAFRRLTAFMDKVVGEPSGVRGSDQFVGFYLNCRDLVEAFPWVPRKLKKAMKQQIVHYFHLAWISEILKTLATYRIGNQDSFEWMDAFIGRVFGDRYHPLPRGANILAHVRAFIENEKERCRLSDMGRLSGLESWPLARMDFLDTLQGQLDSHVSWIGGRPLYFFLDDYTIPIVTSEVQQVLNPIVFSRRSKLFFKVSTESSNSFERRGLRGKPLELNQDFELIDLATESLHKSKKAKTILLENIFRPRIERHELFKGKQLCLKDVLGKTSLSNNQLAKQMRAAVDKGRKGTRKRLLYSGEDTFVGMWASDIRIMIQMFTDMLREAGQSLRRNELPIDKEVQDKVYRTTGGEFLEFVGSVVDPSSLERGPISTRPGEKYGTKLRNIAEAFVNVSRYELTRGQLISNQGRMNPRQAFRLEIVDKFELTDNATRYLDGLIRWHIFLQDWRGKSIRGMITPRLYLNRILVPFCKLTFSSHDNIPFSNSDFISLLTNPTQFPAYWKRKRETIGNSHEKQSAFAFPSQTKGDS